MRTTAEIRDSSVIFALSVKLQGCEVKHAFRYLMLKSEKYFTEMLGIIGSNVTLFQADAHCDLNDSLKNERTDS